MTPVTELVGDLKALRKGRAIFFNHIGDRIGSALRDVCQVTDDDGPAIIRQKVANRLQVLASDLPPDLRVAAMAAFALCPDARMPLYQDRVSWAAVRLNRDPRTARRRIDDAIWQLAQLAMVSPVQTRQQEQPQAIVPASWRTSELRVSMVLDQPRPVLLEQRRIVADRDELTEIDLAFTLAVPRNEFDVVVHYGGTLVERERESSERFAFTLTLPGPLARGESHEYGLQLSLAEGHRTRPYFVCVPRQPCDLFDLRVRFDRSHLPERIRGFRDVFQRDVNDPLSDGERLPVDPAGEIHVMFHGLTPGLAYGARWD